MISDTHAFPFDPEVDEDDIWQPRHPASHPAWHPDEFERRYGMAPMTAGYRWRWALIGLIAYLLSMLFAGQAFCQPATTKPAPIIAVWHAPLSSIATWKSRGVNTMLGAEASTPVDVDAYCAAVKSAGLWIILGDNAKSHWNDSNCIAVMAEPDEPNGSGQQSPGAMLDRIAADREKTAKPILINLDGWQIRWQTDANLAAYCASADWIAADNYPCNRGDANPLATIPTMLARIRKAAPGKRLLCCLETADQHTGVQDWAGNPDDSGTPPRPRMHPPTPLELDAEARAADDFAADYIYFPHFNDPITGAWAGYDGTPPMVVAAVMRINARKLAK